MPIAEAGFDAAPLTRADRYFSEVAGVRRLIAEIPGSRPSPRTRTLASVVIQRLLDLLREARNRYLAADNGFLVLDTIYKLGLAVGRADALQMLAARRHFHSLLHESVRDQQLPLVNSFPPRHVQLLLGWR
ncbi:MAG: hypothetical protein ACT4PM_10005 [Gemmatimonadales bacterium]